METLDLKRIFINDEGTVRAGFWQFIPNCNDVITMT
jgi:hypothetical protein